MPDGSEFTVVTSAADPEHDAGRIDFTVLPDGPAPPPHVHPSQTETFTALEGDSFEVQLDGEWSRLAEGESVAVKPGATHTFRNKGRGTVRVSTVHEPALSFERYIRRLHATAQEHDWQTLGPGAMVRVAVLWSEHSETIRPGPPPLRVAMGAAATFGSLVGLRPAP